MKDIRTILLSVFLIYLGFSSCSKEQVIININGQWEVDLWEYRGCIDKKIDFSYDLTGNGCNLDTITGREQCLDLRFSFDSLNMYSSWLRTEHPNIGRIDTTTEIGFYNIIDNNTMALCQDTICDTLIFVRQGNILDIVFPPDSLIGCGIHYRASFIQ